MDGAAIVDIEALGEQAVLLRWADRVDPAVNRQVHAAAARLRADAPTWLRDGVPASASLAVFFDDAPLVQFDPLRDPPSLLQPGDRVRFVPIDAARFDALQAAPPGPRAEPAS